MENACFSRQQFQFNFVLTSPVNMNRGRDIWGAEDSEESETGVKALEDQ